MELDNIRINILNSIIEEYQNSEDYQALLDLITRGQDISFILKKWALTYVFCMNNSRISWNDGKASLMYIDELATFQMGYYLYCDYVKYFLGASVLYPTMELTFESNLQHYSLVSDGIIDYSKYISQSLTV